MRSTQRRIARPLATLAASAAILATIPMASASAERYFGPYQDEGTCNYWRHAVEQGNPPYHTSVCFWSGPSPAGNFGWFFRAW
jgi:hypothetical protein